MTREQLEKDIRKSIPRSVNGYSLTTTVRIEPDDSNHNKVIVYIDIEDEYGNPFDTLGFSNSLTRFKNFEDNDMFEIDCSRFVRSVKELVLDIIEKINSVDE